MNKEPGCLASLEQAASTPLPFLQHAITAGALALTHVYSCTSKHRLPAHVHVPGAALRCGLHARVWPAATCCHANKPPSPPTCTASHQHSCWCALQKRTLRAVSGAATHLARPLAGLGTPHLSSSAQCCLHLTAPQCTCALSARAPAGTRWPPAWRFGCGGACAHSTPLQRLSWPAGQLVARLPAPFTYAATRQKHPSLHSPSLLLFPGASSAARRELAGTYYGWKLGGSALAL